MIPPGGTHWLTKIGTMRLHSEALAKIGLPQHVGQAMKAMAEEAGFVDVKVRYIALAITYSRNVVYI